ncbi:19774_t:CDS:1 [Racocetra persica]|uniref:19774_t:CDS:1 n=1 Tax=Racocetra persica TaxID=160502 RepID=A0ACA9S416_9GLOM|nr:19774_t:CDS:1 [Racocetra persica]
MSTTGLKCCRKSNCKCSAPLHKEIAITTHEKNLGLVYDEPIKKQRENIKNLSFIEEKYLDQPHIRVAIHKNSKEPVLENWVNHPENRTISKLLKIGNYGLRTGTKLGKYYFCALDIDKKGEQFHFSQISYIRTSKGSHYYLLLKKLPENVPLFYQGEKIRRVMSLGKQVVGSGSIHSSGIIYQFVERGEVFLKFEDKEELADYLNGYGIVLENEKEIQT